MLNSKRLMKNFLQFKALLRKKKSESFKERHGKSDDGKLT